MSPNPQHFRWRTQTTPSPKKGNTTARDAVERVKQGGSAKNDTHVRRIAKDTAEARYCPQGELKDLTPGAVVTLARSFTAAEWAAVKKDSTLLQETLDYFKTADFQIDRWWTYWRNLHLEKPDLAKLFLLEIICEFWKNNVNGLIDAVQHISNGLSIGDLIVFQPDQPVPKRRKANLHYAHPLTSSSVKSSKSSNLAPQSDAEPLAAITGRPEPQLAGLPYAEDRNTRGVPPQLPINNQARESLDNAPLNTTNAHGTNEQQKSGIVPDALRLERTGTISAILNHDNNTPVTAPLTTQNLIQGSKIGPASHISGQQRLDEAAVCDTQSELSLDSIPTHQQSDAAPTCTVTPLLRAIRFQKHILHQIIVQRPNDILGGIWFGSPQGYPPCVLLRLPRALDTIVKPSGQEVYVPGPSPGASSTVTKIYLIKLECFKQIIQRDGFGMIFWNECGEEAFVTMEVIDAGLVEDFIRGAVPD